MPPAPSLPVRLGAAVFLLAADGATVLGLARQRPAGVARGRGGRGFIASARRAISARLQPAATALRGADAR